MDSNDNNNREEHQNARKRKFQEHPEQANDQPDEEGNDFELECLQRKDLIKMVKETKKELKVAKNEAEESATEAKGLAKKLQEVQQQNLIQHGNGQNGVCKSMMAQCDDSLVEELSKQITQLQNEKEELNGRLDKKLVEAMEMHEEIEEKTKLLAEKANEIDALLSQLNEFREEEDMLPNKPMKVQLPLENWTDLLTFVPRRQLVKVVSKIHNRQFAKILQFFLHKCGEVTLGKMEITAPDDEFEIERPFVRAVKRYMKYLLPDVSMPGNVKSFKSIEFSYLNKSVIQFMQEFQRNGMLANLNLAIAWPNCRLPIMKALTHLLPLIDSFDCIDFMWSFVLDKIVGDGKDDQFSELFMKMLEQTRCMGARGLSGAKEKFDVGIAEMYDLCPMAILHRIGVRTKLAAFACRLLPMIARRFGIPTFPSYTPNLSSPRGTPLESSFLDRLLNFYNEMNDWLRADDFPTAAQARLIRRQFGPEFPELKAIVRNITMAFINSSPFLDMPQPISNKIVYIGGLVDEQKKQKGSSSKLDQRSQQILDNAGDGGAVLFSFGSITDTTQMSVQMRRALLRAFARFPSVQFLWKLDSLSAQNDSALFASLPNVHIFEWIQQTAVLNHPNLRAFISHCGLNSMGEASRAGVPVVAIPLFADQAYNAIAIEYTGMAVRLNILELNGPNAEELIVEALNKILNEPKYGQNAKLVSRKLELTPFSPAERLIRWVEFAAEFDNLNELNLPTGDDHFGGWFFYYSLDAISFTLAILVGLIWMAWKCAELLMMTICSIAARLTRKNGPKLKNK